MGPFQSQPFHEAQQKLDTDSWYLQELMFLSLFHQTEVCWFCLCFYVAVERRNKTSEC